MKYHADEQDKTLHLADLEQSSREADPVLFFKQGAQSPRELYF